MFNIILRVALLKIAATLVLSTNKEVPMKQLFKIADILETWVKNKDKVWSDKWLYGDADGIQK